MYNREGEQMEKEEYKKISEAVSYTHLDVYKRQEKIFSVNLLQEAGISTGRH